MNKNFNRAVPFILIAAGILWLLLGMKMLRSHNDFPQTTAVITDIGQHYNNARGEWEHDVTVRYTAEGSSCETELGTYVFYYKVGREVRISYNPSDPDDIQLAGIGQSLIFLGCGALMTVGGITVLLKKRV